LGEKDEKTEDCGAEFYDLGRGLQQVFRQLPLAEIVRRNYQSLY
jgi:hypothetical protein